MKRKLLFSIPMLFAFVLFFSVDVQAQGNEDFTHSTLTGSYADGSFVGNDGITWTYVHSRDEGNFPIDGNGIMLRRADEPSSLSAVLPGGIGSFSVDTRKAFTGNAQRQLELVINGIVVADFLPEYGDGEDDTVIPFIVDDINIGGNVVLELRLFGSTGNQQMVLDNIEWTGYGAVPPVVTNVTQVPDADITSDTTVLVSAHVTEGDAAVTAVELHWGTESGVLENVIEMSPDRAVAYTADEPIPAQANGTTVFYVVYAEDAEGESFTTLETHYVVVDPAMATLPYVETFDEDLGDIYTYSVSGDTKFWVHSTFGDNGFADMNGFNSGDIEDDWLILPGVDMADYSNPVVLNFETAYNFGSFDEDNFLKLFYSEDYAGIGDPTMATWTELEFNVPETGGYTWASSGDVLIPESEGVVHLALQYYYNPGNYRRWQVDNIVIEELIAYETLFELSAANETIPDYFNPAGHTERGFAVDADNVYVASRNAGLFIRVHDRITGELTGTLNTEGISGGTFALNDMETTEDGVVLAGNLAIGDAAIFTVYMVDEDDPALVAIAHPAAGGRYGDKFTVVGSFEDGSALLYAANGSAPNVLKFSMVPTAKGFEFGEPEVISLGIAHGGTPVVAPLPDGSFYYTASGHAVSKLDAEGNLIGAISTGVVAGSSTAMKFLGTDGDDEYLAIYQFGVGNENIRVVRIPGGDPELAEIVFVTPSMFGNANPNGTGDVAFIPQEDGNADLYVMGTNNGVAGYSSLLLNIEPPVYPAYEAPIELPFDLLFNQPYFDGGTAATAALDTEAEIDYEVADNFFGLEDEIEEFVFYGLALKFVDGAWTEQEPDDTEPFFVRFYEYEEAEATGLIAPATGVYQIGLLDSFGDGWNGGTVTVYVNDDAVLSSITLLNGAGPEYHDFNAEAGDMIWTVYTAGNWANENYYAIIDPDDNIIAEDGGTWDNPGATIPSGIEPGGEPVALEPDWANPVAEFSVDTEVTHVGSVWNGEYQLYKFVAPLETPVDLEEGWVSTQIDADNGSGTWFLWINSMVGDELSFQRTEALRTAFSRDIVDLSGLSAKGEIYASRDQLDYDMAFELYGGELSDLPICASNPAPADLAVNVALEGILSWTGDPIAAGYKLYFGYAGGEWEIADGEDLGDETMFAFEGLSFETTYEWKVVPYNALGDAEECPVWTFTTMPDPVLTPPLLETFVGTPFPPMNWTRFSGILSDDTPMTPVTSFWLHHWFGNVTGPAGTQNSAFVNIYGTRNHWLVTPEINLGEGGYQVEFDIALTPWTGTAQTNLGPDDYVAFVISRDGGETWSDANVLIDWTEADEILPTGNHIVLDIADETGIVKFGIYAERPTGFQPDLRFYFTNFQVRTPPVSPIFLISDQEWDFGQVGLMEESQPKEFVISNNGIDVLTVHAPVLENADEFILMYNEDDFPAELEDDNTVSFYAIFAPESVGAKTAQINIPYNDGEENTAMVTLMGTGFERPAGSNCTNPFVAELPLVDYQDNTEAYGNDYLSTMVTPVTSYLNGNDFVVQFTLDEAAALSGSVAGSWTGLIIVADCPNPTNPPQRLALASGASGGSFANLVLEAGTYFAIVSTWPAPQFTDFTLNLSTVPVYTVTFDVTGAFHGYDIDDATITLNGVTNEPGDYVFAGLLEGTYNYSISRLCYETLTGEVFVDDHVTVEAELDLDILPGDANGDGVVNVLDLIAIGSYYIGDDPGHFCFHNADINEDGEIDVLDIIGVVNIFTKGRIAPHAGLQSAPASIYLTETGIELYSDGTLAGIQFEITGGMLQGLDLKLDLPNHEIIYVYQNGTIRAMIFSMDNTAIPAGKISLVSFGNDVEAEWKSVKAGNLNAEEVPVVTHAEEVTSIEEASDIAFTAYPNPASDILWVEFNNTGESSLSLINVQGQVVETQIVHDQGHKQISFNLGNLPAGIYMLRLEHSDVTLTERILIK